MADLPRSLPHRPTAACAKLMCMLLLASTAAAGTLVGTVRIDGNTEFSTRNLLERLTTRPGTSFSSAALRNDLSLITSLYRNEGYLAAESSSAPPEYSDDSALVNIRLLLVEGRRTVLGSIVVFGAAALPPSDLLGQFDTRVGDALNDAVLEQDIAVLIARYERLGYPLVHCSIENIQAQSNGPADSLLLTLRVTEGNRVTIDELRVEGNRETDPDVIIRESRIRYGEVYDPVRLRAIRQRLTRLNIFSSVEEPELYLRHDRGGVLIRVQEGSTSTFDGIIGYIPGPQKGGDGYLTGMVSVAMRNLFGTARKLNVHWQKEDRLSQELAVGYIEPWLFRQPVNLGIEFRQRQQDTSYVRQVLNLKSEVMLSEEISVSVVGGSESVIPSDDSTALRPPKSSTLTIGAEVLYDTRDDMYSATTGARYRADVHYGRKTVTRPGASAASHESIQRFGIDVEFFFPTFPRQVLAQAFHGRQIQGGVLDESELFRFGGTSTLRGYRENQFVGSRIGWTSTEYRFLLARHSFVYGFLDLGYYYRPPDDLRRIIATEAFHYGYGFGIRFDTVLGNLGVGFALGKGDSFGQAKIHFGILNEF